MTVRSCGKTFARFNTGWWECNVKFQAVLLLLGEMITKMTKTKTTNVFGNW